jgi:hypothetical protein
MESRTGIEVNVGTTGTPPVDADTRLALALSLLLLLPR